MDILSIVFYGLVIISLISLVLWLPANYLVWYFTARDKVFLEWLGRVR